VTDLYEAFLQRTPDTSGLNHWVSQVPLVGRSNVRLAFAVSPEFAENVSAICSSTSTGTSTSANLKYILTDAQGSTRAVMNNSGSGTSTIVARHDYLPFGEEIWAGVGLRTSSQKYGQTDKVRQQFALLERDEATGLDHAWFRKHDSFAGRWTSPDPYAGSISLDNPQSFNRYSYVENDPINLTDPTGLMPCIEVVDPATGKTECISLPPETVIIRPSRADQIIDSRGADHGLNYGLWATLNPRPLLGGLAPQKTPGCPPTGAQLANDPKVIAAMQQAWRQSNPGMRHGVRREQGGWIYARNGQTIIRRARAGASGAINLNNPPRVRGALLVGSFHTHPGFHAQGFPLPGPSPVDVALADARNIPELVMSEGMVITAYGPNRRGGNPSIAWDPSDPLITGYPGNSENTSGCP
jgi:RHS repeat-associated protein